MEKNVEMKWNECGDEAHYLYVYLLQKTNFVFKNFKYKTRKIKFLAVKNINYKLHL